MVSNLLGLPRILIPLAAGSVRVQFRKELKEGVKELELCVNCRQTSTPP